MKPILKLLKKVCSHRDNQKNMLDNCGFKLLGNLFLIF